MTDYEKLEMVVNGLECCIWKELPNRCEACPYHVSFCEKKDAYQLKDDALSLLKRLGFLMTTHDEARTMSLEEIKSYLADDDPDKDPLWVQWVTDSVVGGWVLPHTVEDLMWRLESVYYSHWVLWTQKPEDALKEAVKWI